MPLTQLQTFGRATLCQRETKILCKNDLPVSKLTSSRKGETQEKKIRDERKLHKKLARVKKNKRAQ